MIDLVNKVKNIIPGGDEKKEEKKENEVVIDFSKIELFESIEKYINTYLLKDFTNDAIIKLLLIRSEQNTISKLDLNNILSLLLPYEDDKGIKDDRREILLKYLTTPFFLASGKEKEDAIEKYEDFNLKAYLEKTYQNFSFENFQIEEDNSQKPEDIKLDTMTIIIFFILYSPIKDDVKAKYFTQLLQSYFRNNGLVKAKKASFYLVFRRLLSLSIFGIDSIANLEISEIDKEKKEEILGNQEQLKNKELFPKEEAKENENNAEKKTNEYIYKGLKKFYDEEKEEQIKKKNLLTIGCNSVKEEGKSEYDYLRAQFKKKYIRGFQEEIEGRKLRLLMNFNDVVFEFKNLLLYLNHKKELFYSLVNYVAHSTIFYQEEEGNLQIDPKKVMKVIENKKYEVFKSKTLREFFFGYLSKFLADFQRYSNNLGKTLTQLRDQLEPSSTDKDVDYICRVYRFYIYKHKLIKNTELIKEIVASAKKDNNATITKKNSSKKGKKSLWTDELGSNIFDKNMMKKTQDIYNANTKITDEELNKNEMEETGNLILKKEDFIDQTIDYKDEDDSFERERKRNKNEMNPNKTGEIKEVNEENPEESEESDDTLEKEEKHEKPKKEPKPKPMPKYTIGKEILLPKYKIKPGISGEIQPEEKKEPEEIKTEEQFDVVESKDNIFDLPNIDDVEEEPKTNNLRSKRPREKEPELDELLDECFDDDDNKSERKGKVALEGYTKKLTASNIFQSQAFDY